MTGQALVIIMCVWTIVGLIMWRAYVYSMTQMRTGVEIVYLILCGAAAWLSMGTVIYRRRSKQKQRKT